MHLTSVQHDRAAGVLLATAAGDALGAGYEFTHPRPDTVIGMIGGGIGNFEPGEWTDDTSMAIGIAQVAAVKGADLRNAATLDRVAANWVAWYDSHPPDIGNQTRAVLSHRDTTATAMTATASRVPGRTGGNGSLMRTAPVALAHLDDPTAAVEAAQMLSAMTHSDPRAGEACQIWSYAIRHAVVHGNFDGPREYLQTAKPDVASFWSTRLDEAENGSPGDFPNNGWVVHALQTAWSAITNTPTDGPLHLQEALEACVRAGHDTDTTAAIAGGLLGARWGASAVPAEWRRILHGYPGLRARDLVILGLRTIQHGRRPFSWPTLRHLDNSGLPTGKVTSHPDDPGLLLGDADAVPLADVDAVVSMCRMGSEEIAPEHIEFWLVDQPSPANAHPGFVIDDAARTVKALRDEGKRVLLHCVESKSRTVCVAARYSLLTGKDPWHVRRSMPWQLHVEPELWDAAVGYPIARMSPKKDAAKAQFEQSHVTAEPDQ